MAEHRFAKVMNEERERLNQEREALFAEQQVLRDKLDAINREFAAIDAYETAKSGKAAPARRAARRRGSKREQLLELIRHNPDGLARKDILERMGLKGDRSGEMSVSNTLTALAKAKQITRREGKYHLA